MLVIPGLDLARDVAQDTLVTVNVPGHLVDVIRHHLTGDGQEVIVLLKDVVVGALLLHGADHHTGKGFIHSTHLDYYIHT